MAQTDRNRRPASALTQSAPLLQALLAKSADMMTVSDRSGNVIYASPATERVSGYTVEEFVTRHPFETIHPDDRPRCETAFARLLATPGLSLDLQHRVLHKNGSWRWVEGTFTNLFDDPSVNGLVANLRDITRRKEAEADLAAFKLATEHSNDAQYLIDQDARIRWVNRLACEWLGYTFDELTALTVGDINPLVSNAAFDVYFERTRQGRVVPFESIHRRKDGSTLPVEITPTVVEIDGSARMVAAVRDISERKRAQEALQQSEAAFRAIASAAPALVWVFSPSGENIFFNERWYEFTGQTIEQAAGTGWAATMHPDDAGRILPYWERCQKTGETYQGDVRYRRHDGAYRWHVFRALPRRAANGEIEAWYGVSVDTHDARQAQEALRESEKRLRIAVEAARMGTWHWDLTTDEVRWNHHHFALLGLEPSGAPVRPADFFARIHPDDLAHVRQQTERTINERVLFETEFRVVLNDGSTRWVSSYGQVIEEAGGRATRISGVMMGITERKQAEERLRDAAEYHAYILGAFGAADFDVDARTNTLRCSAELKRLYGFPDDFPLTLADCRARYHPDDLAQMITVWTDAREHGQRSWEREYRVVIPDGQDRAGIRWLLARGETLLGTDGELEVVRGAAFDITERKQVEQRIQRQNRVLDGIARIFGEALTSHTEEDLGRVCLQVAEEITGSQFGFMGEINPATGTLDNIAISDRAWQVFGMDSATFPVGRVPMGFAIHGIYGRVLRDGTALFTNDPSSHPDSIGTPSGHPPLQSFLGVPLIRGDETAGMVGLGNREGGYGPAELEMVEALAPAIVQALLSKRTEAALRKSEERQAFLLRLGDALRLLDDPAQIQYEAARTLCEHVRANRVGYGEAQQDGATIVITRNYTDGVRGIEGRYHYNDYGPMLLADLLTGRPVIHSDIPNDPTLTDAQKAAYAALEIGTTINVPLVKAGRLIALLFIHYREAHACSADELALLGETAERTWAVVEQARAEAALRESEERFRLFVTASSDTVYKMSANWTAMHNLVGKDFLASTEQPNRTWIQEYIPEVDQPKVRAAIQDAISTRSTFELEHRVIQLDGTIGWTFSRAIPVLNAQGEIVEWFGTASDVTARRQAEDALRESEAKYRTLFNSMDEGFCILQLIFDPEQRPINYRYVEINPAFERQTGMRGALGRTIRELVPGIEPFWFDIYGRVALTGEPTRFVDHAASMGRWFDVYAFRIGQPDEPKVAVLFNDITERKRREAHLAFLADIAEDFSRHPAADTIMQVIGAKVGTYLGVASCSFCHINDLRDESTAVFAWHAAGTPELPATYCISDYLTHDARQAVRTGKPLVVGDTATDPRIDARSYAALNIQAFVIVPFHRKGEWKFLLSVCDSQPRDWRDDEIELLQELSSRIFPRLERARAEADLRESEARLHAIANLVPDLLWSNDPGGTTPWYNQRWFEYTGQTSEQAYGYGWLDAIHPDERERSQHSFQAASDRGQPLRQELRIRGADGAYRWFLMQAQPLQDDRGQMVRWYGAATDIHEERMALEEARAALETRDQFLSIASHELRTPMTSLLGYTYMLPRAVMHGRGDPVKMTELITRQVERLNMLIDQLLDVSRLQRGQFAIERAPVDVAVIVAQVVDDTRAAQPSDTRHRIEFSRPDEPVIVAGDAQRLEQVVVNLLSNAVKYSPAGGAVRVCVTCTAAQAVVEVEDQGIGIPHDTQARLFDAFYRSSNVGLQISGFGLGLYIVGEIVQRHDGRVEVASQEGVGSTFRVVLPLQTDQL